MRALSLDGQITLITCLKYLNVPGAFLTAVPVYRYTIMCQIRPKYFPQLSKYIILYIWPSLLKLILRVFSEEIPVPPHLARDASSATGGSSQTLNYLK